MAGQLTVLDAMLINEVEEKLTVLPMAAFLNVNEIVSATDETNLDSQVKMQPNPAKSFTTVTSKISSEKIEMFAATGKRLFAQKTNARQAGLQFGSYPAGIYLLHIQTEKGVTVKKLQLF